ncbi:nuclear transport factor 2 family protein [Rhodococcus ruber]|uniref:nuclear transport factor 2 family protein n=1 Tax=Rhodococcus TaxID=1827 RepID=UPI000EEBF9CA|nr:MULTISPECIES: nuclear transport factor 2 family protein [Rhodococcus]RIK09080.1 MAG: nuclear transport factor 2 family protein [Acidobacteriota bacterium]UQB73389.1 nuclear transport factor 2 family protein [Rhodococcus ruber]WML63325.1 nuclear transport factor 2 family protein [Rhodococcus sp. AH-ZY2]
MTSDTTSPDATALEITRSLLHAADTDIARFFGYFSTDCHFRMGNNDPVEGSEAVQQWVASYLGSVAGMQHVILEQWCAGNVTALRVDVTYTMNDGTTFTLPAVTRTRIEDGKVTEYLIFMDPSPVVAAR